jgi:hypothetical protein
MIKYKSDDIWIDLRPLPHKKIGSNLVIDWKNSVGYEIDFQYKNVKNKIKIEKYQLENQRNILYITIDKYVPIPHKIEASKLVLCQIKHLVFNKIIDNAPHLIKYLNNDEDAYLYSCQSNEKIMFKCPICGYTDLVVVSNLYNQGKGCPICSDGISYPTKFMASVLNQLNLSYIREANKSYDDFKWAEMYRYDFTFNLDNKKYIIEVDGGMHRYTTQQKIDKKKNKLAKENGFIMIRIDCDYGCNSKYAFIKNQILQSELSTLFSLDHIDWDECNKFATHTIVKNVCDLWEINKKSIQEISVLTTLSSSTVRRYLKDGKLLGLCPSYNIDNALKRRKSKSDNTNKLTTVKGDDVAC